MHHSTVPGILTGEATREELLGTRGLLAPPQALGPVCPGSRAFGTAKLQGSACLAP